MTNDRQLVGRADVHQVALANGGHHLVAQRRGHRRLEGGDAQIAALVATGAVDVVFFFVDPLWAQPHDPDIRALPRVCNVHNVPLATNVATADLIIAAFDLERFGDALANLLAFTGHPVTREYYVNDAGAQVDVLARSAYLRYREALDRELPTSRSAVGSW